MYTSPVLHLRHPCLQNSTCKRVGASVACHPQPSIAEGEVMSPQVVATVRPHYNRRQCLYICQSGWKGPSHCPACRSRACWLLPSSKNRLPCNRPSIHRPNIHRKRKAIRVLVTSRSRPRLNLSSLNPLAHTAHSLLSHLAALPASPLPKYSIPSCTPLPSSVSVGPCLQRSVHGQSSRREVGSAACSAPSS